MKENNPQSGFILLMSSIVISAILVAVVFSLSLSGFFTRFNLLDSYNKEASLNLAQSCGDIAVLKRIQDASYAGDETLTVSGSFCRVLAFETSGSEIIIKTTATVKNTVSNIQINLDSSTLTINRWREVGAF